MSTKLLSTTHWPQSELVDYEWLRPHLHDKNVKVIEVVYESKGNGMRNKIPDPRVLYMDDDFNKDYYEDNQKQKERFKDLLKRIGVNDMNTTIILYSDFNNWDAAIVFWIFKHFGYKKVKLLEVGGQERPYEEKVCSS